MIHAATAVRQRVTETFTRRIRQGNQFQDVSCIRLRKGVARTLASSRFVQIPQADECKEQRDDCRRLSAQGIKDGTADVTAKLASQRSFALALVGSAQSPNIIFARQKSRLLINMAGGVFENGGLCLDRLSGLPFIPGSAVKGCARRLALAALREWTSAQLKPGDPENLLAPAIKGFDDAADFLFHLALIFGWSDLEWQGREEFNTDRDWEAKRPDFAWACEKTWSDIRENVATSLCKHLGITPKEEHAGTPWKSLPHFAGTIAFLPAYPWDQDPGIDLDVITCHHGEYYNEPTEPDRPQNDPKWQQWTRDHDAWERQWGTAPDTEQPVPVIFPAIAPGQTWAFVLYPTTRAQDNQLKLARTWLSLGLETLGIGAKTNAGYGCFDVKETVSQEVCAKLGAERKRAEEKAQRVKLEAERRQQEEKRRQAREAKAAATADMTPEQEADWRLAQLTPAQFDAKMKAFHKEPKRGGPTDEEKPAIIRALRGPRLEAWTDFKLKAAKGGEPARAEQAIRARNRQLHGDKMP